MIVYVIRNNRTMAILRKSHLEYMAFQTPEGAQEYIQQQRLNPDYFEVVSMYVGHDKKKVPLKYKWKFKGK